MNYLDLLRTQFSNHVSFVEKRPNIYQMIVPLFHEDGDMVDIFLEPTTGTGGAVRVCDHGMTLMRLSYRFELDTDNKRRIFDQILSENQIGEENGNLFIEGAPDRLYPLVLQFAQTVAKISNIEIYKREIMKSEFFDLLTDFIEASLARFNPRRRVLPIPGTDWLEVDYSFDIPQARHALYLFGARDSDKTRLIAITCLELQKARQPFRSMVVHEDFDSLGRKDRGRITSAVDKQFISLDDFRQNAVQFLEREAAAV